jgi:hypothetical protein
MSTPQFNLFVGRPVLSYGKRGFQIGNLRFQITSGRVQNTESRFQIPDHARFHVFPLDRRELVAEG